MAGMTINQEFEDFFKEVDELLEEYEMNKIKLVDVTQNNNGASSSSI